VDFCFWYSGQFFDSGVPIFTTVGDLFEVGCRFCTVGDFLAGPFIFFLNVCAVVLVFKCLHSFLDFHLQF